MRILIVEDEVKLLEAYTEQLQGHHDLVCCSDGREALKSFQHNGSFDLVILDHRLPGKSGEALVFDIKYIKPDQQIAMLSAAVEELNLPLKFGVHKFAKPVLVQDIVNFYTSSLNMNSLSRKA